MKKIKIVNKLTPKNVDFVICNKTGYFKDDKRGICDICKEEIVYRPYIPDNIKKVCIDCFHLKYGKHPVTD